MLYISLTFVSSFSRVYRGSLVLFFYYAAEEFPKNVERVSCRRVNSYPFLMNDLGRLADWIVTVDLLVAESFSNFAPGWLKRGLPPMQSMLYREIDFI